MPDVTFSVDVNCISPTCAVASTRGFTFRVDEPEQLGGTNAGPNPVEYIIGAFGGCLNVMAHLLASEMDVPIESLGIHIEGDLNPAGFMGLDPNQRPGYKQIRVIYDVQSPATEERLNEWLAAFLKRCPVLDIIEHETPVTHTMQVNQMMKAA